MEKKGLEDALPGPNETANIGTGSRAHNAELTNRASSVGNWSKGPRMPGKLHLHAHWRGLVGIGQCTALQGSSQLRGGVLHTYRTP